MSSFAPKHYGLILKKKPGLAAAPGAAKKPLSVFGADEDSDEESAPQKGSATQKAKADVNKQLMALQAKQQVDKSVQKAMEEDPNAFAYDEVYEDLQADKLAALGAKKEATNTKAKPKYIAAILKKAEEKKIEDDRRMERKLKKEREAEGEMFAGKDAFVTAAYKQRLAEMRAAEEAERLREDVDGDVTKKTDMSGFYRNLMSHNVAMGASETEQQPAQTGAPEGPPSQAREEREAESERQVEDHDTEPVVEQQGSPVAEKKRTHAVVEAAPIESDADVKAKYARRNDEDRVAAARAAALARRKAGQATAAKVQVDD